MERWPTYRIRSFTTNHIQRHALDKVKMLKNSLSLAEAGGYSLEMVQTRQLGNSERYQVALFEHQLKLKIRSHPKRLLLTDFKKRGVKVARLVRMNGTSLDLNFTFTLIQKGGFLRNLPLVKQDSLPR